MVKAMVNQGGYSHVKAYGDVPPKWVTFSPEILRQVFNFGLKKSLEEGPISPKLQKKKNEKSAISEFKKKKKP